MVSINGLLEKNQRKIKNNKKHEKYILENNIE